MANIVAVEWDGREVRLACVETQSRGPVMTHADAITWPGESTSDEASSTVLGSTSELASAIAAKLHDWNVSKAEAIVAVRRARVELRMMNVPPVPDDELPDLVRFQALQQFAALGEDWPLDYLRLAADEGEPQRVLAAVLAPEDLAGIVEVCNAVPLSLQGLVLRPGATASLAQRRQMIAEDEFQLLVDLLPEEADLTVLDRHTIHIMRSVRLPSSQHYSESERRTTVMTEIRRTLAAGRSQLKGGLIHGVILCGGGSQQEWLETNIQEQLQLPVTYLSPLEESATGDPGSDLRLSATLEREPPRHPERYAALVGMLLDEASSTRHAIDFLRPRRPAPPPDQRKRWTQIGVLATAALLLLILGFWWLLGRRDAAIADLRKDSRELDKLVEVAEEQREDVDEIDAWYRDSPNWLVELKELSERLPPADQLRLDLLQADVTAKGGGVILLKGSVDKSSTVSELETSLRDQWHGVVGIDRADIGEDRKYPWHFTERINIQSRHLATDRDAESPAVIEDPAPPGGNTPAQGDPTS